MYKISPKYRRFVLSGISRKESYPPPFSKLETIIRRRGGVFTPLFYLKANIGSVLVLVATGEKNYYKILNIDEKSTTKDIKKVSIKRFFLFILIFQIVNHTIYYKSVPSIQFGIFFRCVILTIQNDFFLTFFFQKIIPYFYLDLKNIYLYFSRLRSRNPRVWFISWFIY